MPRTRDSLGGVDDDDELFGSRGYDFFVKQRAAAAFDEAELGVDFVGAVDGYIDLLAFVEVRDWDAQTGGLFLRAD